MTDITANLERVKATCEVTDYEAAQVTAQVALRILVEKRELLCDTCPCHDCARVTAEEIDNFVLKDSTGMWAKAEAALKAMDAQ